MGLANRLRAAVSAKLELVAEGLGVVFSLSGATVAAVLGKFIIGAVLAGVALGFVLRLKSRTRKVVPAAALAQRPTLLSRLVTAAISTLEVALVVEAANLPVRFDQPGFHMSHWYLVVLALAAAYLLQLPLFTRLLTKRHTPGAA